ncbi:unnamed protein product [Echinostoma caproni]|uniref:Thioredoxin n=1 Tax=Echinostoma caproni TaxID=27848 RepID=A0A183A683_9TREM|nr:unnamed protein product [Echinostoma caproni]
MTLEFQRFLILWSRNKRLRNKRRGRHKKDRAGWQVAFRRSSINRMTIPSISSSNIHSLVGKIDDVQNLAQQKQCKSVGIILLQEDWLHPDIEDDVDGSDGFDIVGDDRIVKFRNRGGGVVTFFLNRSWCKFCLDEGRAGEAWRAITHEDIETMISELPQLLSDTAYGTPWLRIDERWNVLDE